MKMHIVCGVFAFGLLVGGASAAPKIGTTVGELPEAVQKTIKAQAPNAKIGDRWNDCKRR